jgi:hypothetical protein
LYDIDVIIPQVECTKCVLKWKYHAGNNWGCDAVNDCGIGKGPQEEFHNCADVKISDNNGNNSTTTIEPTTTKTTTTITTTTEEGRTCKVNCFEIIPVIKLWQG